MDRHEAARDDALAVEMLPQRPPFRLLTRAEFNGGCARGRWVLDGGESFFSGHFPNDPVVPGVLIVESMAQLASLAMAAPTGTPPRDGAGTIDSRARETAADGRGTARASVVAPPLLVRIDVRFRSVVRPPAELLLEARLDREIGPLAEFEASARLGDRVVAEGRLTLRAGSVA